jgi:hypothetical protein
MLQPEDKKWRKAMLSKYLQWSVIGDLFLAQRVHWVSLK